MPRKGNVPVREVLPDPLYNDVRVTKLINNIMQDGKKGVAQKICYDCLLYTSPSPRDRTRSRMPSSA